jgi:hypothetical protein
MKIIKEVKQQMPIPNAIMVWAATRRRCVVWGESSSSEDSAGFSGLWRTGQRILVDNLLRFFLAKIRIFAGKNLAAMVFHITHNIDIFDNRLEGDVNMRTLFIGAAGFMLPQMRDEDLSACHLPIFGFDFSPSFACA